MSAANLNSDLGIERETAWRTVAPFVESILAGDRGPISGDKRALYRDIATLLEWLSELREDDWPSTDDEEIDSIVDSENVVLMHRLIYKLKSERDAARRAVGAPTPATPEDPNEPEFVIVEGYDEIEALPFTGDIEAL